MPSEKQFCIDCRYHKYMWNRPSLTESHVCNHITNIIDTPNIVTGETAYVANCSQLRSYRPVVCPYYEVSMASLKHPLHVGNKDNKAVSEHTRLKNLSLDDI